jgi:hypothetical protein
MLENKGKQNLNRTGYADKQALCCKKKALKNRNIIHFSVLLNRFAMLSNENFVKYRFLVSYFLEIIIKTGGVMINLAFFVIFRFFMVEKITLFDIIYVFYIFCNACNYYSG